MKRDRVFFLVAALAIRLFPPAVCASNLVELTEPISSEMIRRHVVVLGSDAMEGRAPGTRGGNRASVYLASELERLGLSPMGDDAGFFQQVPLNGHRPRPECRLTLSSLGETVELDLGDDYLLVTTGEQTLVPRPTPMVFVGYGIVAPEFDYNDYAEVDVRGKVVVFLDGEPSSTDPSFFLGDEPSIYEALETKQRIALSRGAVGSVLIPRKGLRAEEWARKRRMYAFEHITAASAVPRHLSVILHPARAESLFVEALFDHEAVLEMARQHRLRSFHLPVQLAFAGSFDSRSFLSPNVVGMLKGADPELAGTFVVISAHYDHLGIGPAIGDDTIYNGVVDNALGVAGALEIARLLAERPKRPRRSVIFLFTTAEEAGNLGSVFFLDHSPVPLPKMVANVNIDGLAFLEPFTDLVGIGGELSSLGELLQRASAPLGLAVAAADEIMWSHEAFMRSDQAAFAEVGVPSILVNEGLRWRGATVAEAAHRLWCWFETRYHSPQDDLHQPLDFEVSRMHCRAVAALVWTVGDSRREPDWKPGTRYAYQRLLSKAHRD